MTVNLAFFKKDAQAKLDYTVDFSNWLVGNDTLQSSVWTLTSGITKTSTSLSSTAATIWLSSGVEDSQYLITLRITTADGRIDEKAFTVTIV